MGVGRRGATVLTLAWRTRRAGAGWAVPLVAGLLAAQIGLGIATLLTGVALPIAAAHQLVGALLLAGVVTVAHRLGTRAR